MRTVISALAAIIVPAVGLAQALDDNARRATVTSDQARQIAQNLFPDKCGSDACFITFDDRRGGLFEFVVLFPVEILGSNYFSHISRGSK